MNKIGEIRRKMMTDRDNAVTLTLTRDEVSTLSAVLIQWSRMMYGQDKYKEGEDLDNLRMKIQGQQ